MEARVVRWGNDLAVRLTPEDVVRLGLSEGQTGEVIATPRPLPLRGGNDTAVPGPVVEGLPVYAMAELVAEARRLGPDAEPPTVDWGFDPGSEIIDDDEPN